MVNIVIIQKGPGYLFDVADEVFGTNFKNSRGYLITMTVYDPYDFKYLSEKDQKNLVIRFINNNFGNNLQNNKSLIPYNWQIKFNFYYFYVCKHGY